MDLPLGGKRRFEDEDKKTAAWNEMGGKSK